MSSYRDEFLRLTMGRLSVVDGFETNSWPHRHSRCNFKKWWIFMIFDFLNCGFWHLSGRISIIRPNIGRLMLFSKKVHRNLFPNLAVPGLTQIRHLDSIFYEKTRKNGFYGMLCVKYSTAVEYSTGPEISTIEKFITSATCYICTVFSYLT